MSEVTPNPEVARIMAEISALSTEMVMTIEGLAHPKSLGSFLRDLDAIAKRCHELGDRWTEVKLVALDQPVPGTDEKPT